MTQGHSETGPSGIYMQDNSDEYQIASGYRAGDSHVCLDSSFSRLTTGKDASKVQIDVAAVFVVIAADVCSSFTS